MFGNQSLQQYIFGNTKMLEFDLQENGLRKLNSALHDQKENSNQTVWKITNPKGEPRNCCWNRRTHRSKH